uniref:Uncharacterized protein n=1 Tax=Oryza nivara TaxID=4536 RepID=A0A0E0I8C8_ORYNI
MDRKLDMHYIYLKSSLCLISRRTKLTIPKIDINFPLYRASLISFASYELPDSSCCHRVPLPGARSRAAAAAGVPCLRGAAAGRLPDQGRPAGAVPRRRRRRRDHQPRPPPPPPPRRRILERMLRCTLLLLPPRHVLLMSKHGGSSIMHAW